MQLASSASSCSVHGAWSLGKDRSMIRWRMSAQAVAALLFVPTLPSSFPHWRQSAFDVICHFRAGPRDTHASTQSGNRVCNDVECVALHRSAKWSPAPPCYIRVRASTATLVVLHNQPNCLHAEERHSLQLRVQTHRFQALPTIGLPARKTQLTARLRAESVIIPSLGPISSLRLL